MIDHHVQGVAADVNREGLVYSGTFGEGAFVSDDGGSIRTLIPSIYFGL